MQFHWHLICTYIWLSLSFFSWFDYCSDITFNLCFSWVIVYFFCNDIFLFSSDNQSGFLVCMCDLRVFRNKNDLLNILDSYPDPTGSSPWLGYENKPIWLSGYVVCQVLPKYCVRTSAPPDIEWPWASH